MRYLPLLLILLFIVTACGRRTQDPNVLIDQAVAATVAAMPQPTRDTRPIPTPYPTPTPFDLRGLFCEYQFCMGHPIDMAFFDVSAQQNAGAPSTYTQGILASYNANLFLQMMWQISPGASDPQFLLDLILDDGIDTAVGNREVKLIRDMNVVYTPITTTATLVLPYGGAAAWTCGERVFAWKAYTPDEASASGLFETSFARFNCNR
ncbi:MAG TPA: hypothetical protein VK897_11755 [Anaerolineales bacterium]|nr:hypothetical protein [Anaerolineales bacterium]